jgi:hypothetical protein
MTVRELSLACDFKAICLADGDRTVKGAYAGDLLSWVMGRASCDNAWITIMSNVNVIAVASLSDVSCVIFAEGVAPDAEILKLAEEKEINLLSSELPTFETAAKLSAFIK